MRPRIKICGLTRLEDAALAASLGAFALGFVFAPSKRQVDPSRVRAITAALPPNVSKVGVFGPDARASVARIAEECGLDTVQLHGTPDPELCDSLRGRFTVVQAIGVDGDRQALQSRVTAIAPHVDRLLLDTASTRLLGGTGRTFEWEVLAQLDCRVPLIVAGGLDATNVGELVRRHAPWGVDVASGVEATPGIKDAERLRAFFAAL
ncbi:MAG TPA: phosphoribosylanthranilate isomerase [Oscillatoriaceae cyanobacterium]